MRSLFTLCCILQLSLKNAYDLILLLIFTIKKIPERKTDLLLLILSYCGVSINVISVQIFILTLNGFKQVFTLCVALS